VVRFWGTSQSGFAEPVNVILAIQATQT
jgi:hypothetical protein